MNQLHDTIVALRDAGQAANLARFFRTGPGQYGEGDRFLGVKVPATRAVVKELWRGCTFDELDECLASPWHEVRLAALLVLVQQFHHAKRQPDLQQRCIDFYLSHLDAVNNWDLVDLSCYELLGTWLLDRDATLLHDLARHGATVWQQRIGIVSTMQFIRHGQLDDTYALADIFLRKPQPLHDLLQKAVGWLLREAGKRDEQRLKDWLSTRCQPMPRTMLRYAIEKFSEHDRHAFLHCYYIRTSTKEDLPIILNLRDQAREIMRSYGNVNQWPNGYPRDDTFRKDIELGGSHVMLNASGEIVGTFTLLPSPEVTYNVIYNGQWLDDEPYHVIHRIASTPDSHGVLDAVLDYCQAIAPNIRIDTHEANVIMRKGLKRHGYQYCGIIHLLNGNERMAYQKHIKP